MSVNCIKRLSVTAQHNCVGRAVLTTPSLRDITSSSVINVPIGMRRITTIRSTTDHTYDGGPIRLKYCNNIIIYYNTYDCVTIAYSIQYSKMLYRIVA